MFGLFEKSKAEVIDHWYALIPGFNTSTKEFYEATCSTYFSNIDLLYALPW